ADAGAARDRLGNLGRRDVFALPAEGVADAVDEVEEAARVLAHQIAGAEPGVAGREHVAQDLFGRSGLVGIALERRPALVPAGNPADRLADFTGDAALAQPVLAAH